MSSINSVRNLQIFYFSKKSKEIKELKKHEKKSVPEPPSIYTTLQSPTICLGKLRTLRRLIQLQCKFTHFKIQKATTYFV